MQILRHNRISLTSQIYTEARAPRPGQRSGGSASTWGPATTLKERPRGSTSPLYLLAKSPLRRRRARTWKSARRLEPLTFCLQARSATSRTVPTGLLTRAAPFRTSTPVRAHPTPLLAPPLAFRQARRVRTRVSRERCGRQLRAGVPAGPQGLGVARPPLRARPAGTVALPSFAYPACLRHPGSGFMGSDLQVAHRACANFDLH